MESDLFHPHAPHIIENNRRRTPQWKAYVCWLDSLECRAHRNAESGSCLPQIGTVKLSIILGFWRRNRSSAERRINNLESGQGAE